MLSELAPVPYLLPEATVGTGVHDPGLGVCGDWLGGGVEAAWHLGAELADHRAASFERVEVAPEMAWAVT